ncbi:hypothetical protein GUJ93_ZPchr0003g17835 [Zizania palustris]|uniref:Uncharacterized protein n=1 Tax=Zizania palustris TaxID=103762 RepID=A0A8J5VCZ1_ZIZPA|nr:hypothetical protein GUJ93_ZPchr0003g17835 [Zizania palustris]
MGPCLTKEDGDRRRRAWRPVRRGDGGGRKLRVEDAEADAQRGRRRRGVDKGSGRRRWIRALECGGFGGRDDP